MDSRSNDGRTVMGEGAGGAAAQLHRAHLEGVPAQHCRAVSGPRNPQVPAPRSQISDIPRSSSQS